MNIKCKVNQAEALRLGIDAPHSVVVLEVDWAGRQAEVDRVTEAIVNLQAETVEALDKVPRGSVSRLSQDIGLREGEPLIVGLDGILRYAKAYEARPALRRLEWRRQQMKIEIKNR